MSTGMEAVRDTIRKADEALRKASEPSDYVGSTSAFKAESPPVPPSNPEPQRRSPSVPPPERPSPTYSPSINDSWRSPQVPNVILPEAIPRMYNSIDSNRLNMVRHRSVSPVRARDRLGVSMSEASTEFLSPQALDYLKHSGRDMSMTQPIRGVRSPNGYSTVNTIPNTTPTIQIVQKMPAVSAPPVVEQIVANKQPGDSASGEYVRMLENEINLMREKLHFEQAQREDFAEKYKQHISKYHQTAEDKFQLEQLLNRTMKDAEGVGDLSRRLREEADLRTHADAQVAQLHKQLKQSHAELEESVESIRKLTRATQYKDDEIADLRQQHQLAEERADAAMERAKAQAREEVSGDLRMMREAGDKDSAELRRRLETVTEDARREKEGLERRVEEALAGREAARAEGQQQVERVRAEEERHKAELRARVSELMQAENRETQSVRERAEREKDELRQRAESAKAAEDRDKADLRRRLDDAIQEKDQSWRAVATLRENLQRCMADLSHANSRLKENETRIRDREGRLQDAEQSKAKMLLVIEELKRALGDTTDLNDAAKEELFFLRGRVQDLEERAQQQPPPQDRYRVPGGASPPGEYRQNRMVSPSNYDTPPIPNNLATRPDEPRSENSSEPGFGGLAVDPNEIEAGVEVQM